LEFKDFGRALPLLEAPLQALLIVRAEEALALIARVQVGERRVDALRPLAYPAQRKAKLVDLLGGLGHIGADAHFGLGH
jgi:hypothetical protein